MGDQQLHVFANEIVEWIVAENEQDAIKVWEETTGEKWQDYATREDVSFRQCPDDEQITINCEDLLAEGHRPAGALIVDSGPGWEKLRATMRAWADVNGRGYLCSSDW